MELHLLELLLLLDAFVQFDLFFQLLASRVEVEVSFLLFALFFVPEFASDRGILFTFRLQILQVGQRKFAGGFRRWDS